MINEIKKVIDKNYEDLHLIEAFRYSQGYINGLRYASKYEVLEGQEWYKLVKYIHEKFREKLDLSCNTEKIMEKIKKEKSIRSKRWIFLKKKE